MSKTKTEEIKIIKNRNPTECTCQRHEAKASPRFQIFVVVGSIITSDGKVDREIET